jgi:hypothetical protein
MPMHGDGHRAAHSELLHQCVPRRRARLDTEAGNFLRTIAQPGRRHQPAAARIARIEHRIEVAHPMRLDKGGRFFPGGILDHQAVLGIRPIYHRPTNARQLGQRVQFRLHPACGEHPAVHRPGQRSLVLIDGGLHGLQLALAVQL